MDSSMQKAVSSDQVAGATEAPNVIAKRLNEGMGLGHTSKRICTHPRSCHFVEFGVVWCSNCAERVVTKDSTLTK